MGLGFGGRLQSSLNQRAYSFVFDSFNHQMAAFNFVVPFNIAC